MTADLGIGANISIESAVTIANIFHRELQSSLNRHFSTTELCALFAEYQNDRFDRAKAFVELSGKVTRAHSFRTPFARLFACYVAPYLQSINTKKFAAAFAKSPKLSYVPVRTIDESAEGWQLGKGQGGAAPWLRYGMIMVVVGMPIAYMATAWLSGSLVH